FSTEAWAEAGLWPFPLQGILAARLDLRGPLASPKGAVSFRVLNAKWEDVAMGSVIASGEIRRELLHVKELHWESPGGTVNVNGTFPLTKRAGRFPDFVVSVQSSGLDLAFLKGFFPKVSWESALFQSDLRLAHRSGRLTAHGSARLAAQDVRLSEDQVRLEDVALMIRGENDSIRIATGTARSGKGKLVLSGALRLNGPDLRVQAENFPWAAPWGFSGRIKTDIRYMGSWEAPRLAGKVKILEGDYTPVKKEKKKAGKSKSLFSALRRGEKPDKADSGGKESRPSGLAMDLDVSYDKNVWFKKEASAIETQGAFDVMKKRYEPVRVLGFVESIRGHYIYYGRTFQIQEGRVTFIGDSPPNPQLNVNALYVAEESGTRITLRLEGTAKQPQLTLTSEPPLAEQDILSVLLFGAPLDQAGTPTGDGIGRETAMEVLSGYFLSQLRQTPGFQELDIDVFQVKQTPEGQREVTVGRYLTEDLYLSYEQTLGELAQRQIRAEYTLTPHWSLLGQSGGSVAGPRFFVDLMFNFSIK
ncbi:MAG: translocation/assembly module TamB, partial [Elusimicrobia bacterium]|nr:translocation/assembly module TamB [Elusimicrobiota bacterium]